VAAPVFDERFDAKLDDRLGAGLDTFFQLLVMLADHADRRIGNDTFGHPIEGGPVKMYFACDGRERRLILKVRNK
jgi:hypothetical protein